MRWEFDKRGNCLAILDAGFPRFEAMKELCAQVAEYILPRNREVKWEFLRVEVWSDSGQVVVFPSADVESYRIEKVACQLVFKELSEWFANLESSLSDDELATLVEDKEREWGDLFLIAAAVCNLGGLRTKVFAAAGDLLREQVVKPDFSAMTLEGFNFDDAELSNAVFEAADLYWASFFRTNLTQANLDRADLRGADLKQACLRNATLHKANLGLDNLNLATHLDGADLRGADLTTAICEGAIFVGAIYDNATKFPVGFDPTARQMTQSN